MSEIVHVVAGVLRAPDGSILVSKRPDGVHQGGLWEFPGGKLESGETPRQTLARELEEELGVQVSVARPLLSVRHTYSECTVLLDTWLVEEYAGEPTGREGQPLDWVRPEDLDPDAFPPADRPIISALNDRGRGHDSAPERAR